MEERDQVINTDLEFDKLEEATFFNKEPETKGPFFNERDIVIKKKNNFTRKDLKNKKHIKITKTKKHYQTAFLDRIMYRLL